MFFLLRQTSLRQSSQLIVALLLAILFYSQLHFLPLLRPSLSMLLLGVFSGMLIAFLSLSITLALLLFPRLQLQPALQNEQRAFRAQTPAERLGSLFAASGGETFILCGLLFGYLLDSQAVWAWILLAAISFLGSLSMRFDFTRAAIRLLEYLCFGCLYYEHRSMFLLFIARFIQEGIYLLATNSSWALYMLHENQLSWRKLYEWRKFAPSALPRVR